MSDESGDSSFFDGALHFAEGALDAVGHAAEGVAEGTVHAFQSAGMAAEDAAQMVAPELEMIPGIAEGVAIGTTAYHGLAAVGDAITGDWDGAADQSMSMAESAVSAATGGLFGMAEGAWDMVDPLGGGEATSAHALISSGAHAVGDAMGDAAYDLLNPAEAE